MQKRYKKKIDNRKLYRLNDRIIARELRVLDAEGKQIGVLPRAEALQKARDEEVDLVEIVPQATPPVAKIIDFNKFLYQQEKKKREEKRHAKVSETKEVRLGPFMNSHDLDVMVRRAREFLEDSDKVRFVVKFRGRQIVHPEFGQEIMGKVVNALSDIGKVEKEARFEGKQLVTIVAPERKKPSASNGGENTEHAETKSEEVSSEAV